MQKICVPCMLYCRWCHIFPNVLFLMLLLAWHKLFIKHSFTCEKNTPRERQRKKRVKIVRHTAHVRVSTPGTFIIPQTLEITFILNRLFAPAFSFLLWIQKHKCCIKVNASLDVREGKGISFWEFNSAKKKELMYKMCRWINSIKSYKLIIPAVLLNPLAHLKGFFLHAWLSKSFGRALIYVLWII